MATTAVSIHEYLSTSYRPDCDYVDGEIRERNLGEADHSRLQLALGAYFYNHRKEAGITAFMEQRVQVSSTRFRVADICVILGEPASQILREPPFICIEILSPDDSFTRTNERVNDYLEFGVPYVWIIDPKDPQSLALHAGRDAGSPRASDRETQHRCGSGKLFD